MTVFLSAYEEFLKEISKKKFGVFFCVNDPDIGEHWVFGVGTPILADFEKGPFPFFSVVDFLGNKKHFWHFKKYYSGSQKTTEIAIKAENFTENNFIKFDLVQKSHFLQNVEKVQKSQKNGENWVLNLAENFEIEAQELFGKNFCTVEKMPFLSLFKKFLKLKKRFCGGVVFTEEQKFCSLSPEVFLHQTPEKISTFPIKGTGSLAYLETSEKEISELRMVVDLLRNDFGQICKKVWVEKERFLTDENGFYHARAKISGNLRRSENLYLDDFLALLPAGSVSGSPKKRVVAQILALELFERNFFTGTFGVKFSPTESIFNILIRTLFWDEKTKKLHFPVGAGITVESSPTREWEELGRKQKILWDVGR